MSNKDKIWIHRCLGHPSFEVLKLMFLYFSKGRVLSLFIVMIVNLQDINALPFQTIQDIWGSSTAPNISGARWFVSFIDDCTRVAWIYLLRNKIRSQHCFSQFLRHAV